MLKKELVLNIWWNDTERGKPNSWRRTSPSANLSTTNPTQAGVGSNMGICSNRPVINHLR